jgi:hypothetical protein
MACRSVAARILAALSAVPLLAPRNSHHSLRMPEYVTRVAGDLSERKADILSHTLWAPEAVDISIIDDIELF